MTAGALYTIKLFNIRIFLWFMSYISKSSSVQEIQTINEPATHC